MKINDARKVLKNLILVLFFVLASTQPFDLNFLTFSRAFCFTTNFNIHVFSRFSFSFFSQSTKLTKFACETNMQSGDNHLVINLIMIELLGTIFFLAIVTICIYIKRYFVRKSLSGCKVLVSNSNVFNQADWISAIFDSIYKNTY